MDTITPQLYSGALRPYPGVPAEWSTAKQARARRILADVDAAFPGMVGEVDPSADVEDFWEDAARISAAWRATGGRLVLKEAGTSRCAWSKDEMLRRIGPVTRSEEGGDHGTDDLAGHALVARHGGRGMFVGGVATNDPTRDVAIWLAARHRNHGIRRGVVKAVARKNGIWSIELDSDPEVVTRRLADAMEWTFVRLEGLSSALLAQDELELTWEYRLFVVDGRVVSAAGCIEAFTPLDHDRAAGLIDTRVRRIRGHLEQGLPSPVEDRPDIVHRLVSFGRRVALEHGGTVCIDVAIDAATDEPVVIELNHLPNSGLYASDPWAVTAPPWSERATAATHPSGARRTFSDQPRRQKEFPHEQVRSRPPGPTPLGKERLHRMPGLRPRPLQEHPQPRHPSPEDRPHRRTLG